MFCPKEYALPKKGKTTTKIDIKSKEKLKNEEVDKVEWVTVYEAINLLRYPQEQSLLRSAHRLSDRKTAFFSGVRKRFKSSSHKRLDSAIEPFELELKQKIKEIFAKGFSDISIRRREAALTALQMIECAKRALSLCEIELGWRFFYQAELISLYLIEDEKDALKERALATLIEK